MHLIVVMDCQIHPWVHCIRHARPACPLAHFSLVHHSCGNRFRETRLDWWAYLAMSCWTVFWYSEVSYLLPVKPSYQTLQILEAYPIPNLHSSPSVKAEEVGILLYPCPWQGAELAERKNSLRSSLRFLLSSSCALFYLPKFFSLRML